MVYSQFHKKDSSHNLISWLLKYTTCTPLRTISYVGILNEKTTSWQKYFYSQSISYSIDSYRQDNCKAVIYKYVFCWLLFCAKFDCNFIQSFVPCIYCGICL